MITRWSIKTKAIIKKLHAVLLLDEIEKAHSSVLLQIINYSTLTNNNHKTNFCKIIIIMTTNVGVKNYKNTLLDLLILLKIVMQL